MKKNKRTLGFNGELKWYEKQKKERRNNTIPFGTLWLLRMLCWNMWCFYVWQLKKKNATHNDLIRRTTQRVCCKFIFRFFCSVCFWIHVSTVKIDYARFACCCCFYWCSFTISSAQLQLMKIESIFALQFDCLSVWWLFLWPANTFVCVCIRMRIE